MPKQSTTATNPAEKMCTQRVTPTRKNGEQLKNETRRTTQIEPGIATEQIVTCSPRSSGTITVQNCIKQLSKTNERSTPMFKSVLYRSAGANTHPTREKRCLMPNQPAITPSVRSKTSNKMSRRTTGTESNCSLGLANQLQPLLSVPKSMSAMTQGEKAYSSTRGNEDVKTS